MEKLIHTRSRIAAPVAGALAAGIFLAALFVSTMAAAEVKPEIEPNDTPGTANELFFRQEVFSGTIQPSGDVDYYYYDGENHLWGYVALLDTSDSSSSITGTLTAFGADGTTQLQSDSGSWRNGSVIVWQRYVNGQQPHYLRVTETGDDAEITPYTLRYYSVAIGEEPEIEPNNSPETATISAKSMTGAITETTDVDCFSISVHAGEKFIFALNADPDNDGSSTNYTLAVFNPLGALIESADTGGAGDNEVIDTITLSENGIYAYCLHTSDGTFDPNDTYLVGALRNGYNYLPAYQLDPQWLEPGPDGSATPGSTLTFQLNFINTGALTIPGRIEMFGKIDPLCSTVVSAPGSVSMTDSRAEWEMENLGPGKVFTATIGARAEAACHDNLHQSVVLDYYELGMGSDVDYVIEAGLYLPLILK